MSGTTRIHQPICECHAREGLGEAQGDTEGNNAFIGRLEGCVKTGADIGMPLSQIIKEKYPDSSKSALAAAGSSVGSKDTNQLFILLYILFSFSPLSNILCSLILPATRSPRGKVPWKICLFDLLLNCSILSLRINIHILREFSIHFQSPNQSLNYAPFFSLAQSSQRP